MKDKKRIIIILIILIVSIAVIYFFNRKNSIVFSLKGDSTVNLPYGTVFIEPGYTAEDGFGNNLESNVLVSGNVDIYTSGVYKINYELNYQGEKKNLVRIVHVGNIKPNDLKIVLNGEENVYLLRNEEYEEAGGYILNNITNSKYEENIDINSNVNTSKNGVYYVDYVYYYNGGSVRATRTVTVFDIEYKLSQEELTQDKVRIIIDLSNIREYKSIKLPNGNTSMEKTIEYEVDSNGIYDFIVILSNQQEFTKRIEVNNILKGYTCIGEITGKGTKIEVTNTDGVKDYEWTIDNTSIKGTNIYEKGKIIQKAQVKLTFNNSKQYQMTCKIEDKLLYHFKYDENRIKEKMSCNTYTAADKARLDTLLKKVIEEAGYGTRAGVVAAARFVVGGLDYKIPYQGGQRYNEVGLNIGQKGAWGCSSSGIDCYYFIDWLRTQNGLRLGANYANTQNYTNSDVSKIRVGDYLLAPCTTDTCKNIYKINHIAIVIGIDDKYIYVAEATTGGINGVVVTKLDKSKMPKERGLSKVRYVEYPSEGNVTNMWMQ